MQRGIFSVQQPCPTCGGRGQTIAKPCKSCRGNGRVQSEKTLQVKIPAGVDNGDRIRLQGEGEAGPGGAPAGDLYVEVHVREHEIFQRDGDDLYCEVPIRFSQAALGADIVVPTLQGEALIKVPVETQTGKLFRLRGKGVKSVRSHSHRRPAVPGGGRNAGQPDREAARAAARNSRRPSKARRARGIRRDPAASSTASNRSGTG